MQLVQEASEHGYNVCVINAAVGPPPGHGDEKGIQTCDFSSNIYIEEAVELIREKFGSH